MQEHGRSKEGFANTQYMPTFHTHAQTQQWWSFQKLEFHVPLLNMFLQQW